MMSSSQPAHDRHDGELVPPDDGQRTLNTLKAIQAGTRDPKTINRQGRQQLVEYLMGDGYSTVDIAEIFKRTERTIERDKKAIHQANALQPDPELADQMAGRLFAEAELSIQRIRKATRDKRVKPAVKIHAERECFAIISDLTQRLQGLGHLPTAAQKLEAAVLHMGELPSFDDLQDELGRLRAVASSAGGRGPALLAQLYELEAHTQQAKLALQTEELSEQITEAKGDDDEPEESDASA